MSSHAALFAALLTVAAAPLLAAPAERLPLSGDWQLRSAAGLTQDGRALSTAATGLEGWHAIRVPNTVVGALVENGSLPEPYFGMNLRSIPGTSYPIGERFTLLPTPPDSPYKSPWWYRKQFVAPAALRGRSAWLNFEGINYRANVWFNGTRLGDAAQVAGAFRRHVFEVTKLLRPGQDNVLALEVFGPEPHDLAFMWVDWNPTPADKNMGLWGDVYLTDSGPLDLRDAHVVSQLALPGLERARLTVTVEAVNTSDRPLRATVRGTLGALRFARELDLAAGARQQVRFTPADTPGLQIEAPRVWWPYRMGTQELYELVLEADAQGAPSDREAVTFGIQQMSSELDSAGQRVFKVNGRPVLIRGGGWASDMLLRPASRARLEAELRYVQAMGLNTVRLEGKLESDLFYDLADRLGILVMPGWCCCDQWEKWDQWDAEDHEVAPLALRDQILRLRNHPSVLAWFNGSDFPPPAPVERKYLDVLAKLDWDRPVLSNATDAPGPVSGPSGVKMRGPYDYVPPSYWLTDTKNGGAFGFATEIGPGAAVPPLESLKAMLPPEHLWPIDAVWNFHAGGDEFRDITRFTTALEARYGKARGVEDYARKAQALTYDNQRAMFEAYGRNKYRSTGVIQWMLNNAWPSLIWHLYDYYLRPGGGYYGTQRACEPLHVQFSYDDRGVDVVNDLQQGFKGLRVKAQVFDLALNAKFTGEAAVDVAADGVARALVVPRPEGVDGAYFLRLQLVDAAGQTRSTNVYWLSTREDVLDWAGTKWFYTPTKTHADLTALERLPATQLALRTRFESQRSEGQARVTVENTGRMLAFQVHLRLLDAASGQEPTPVYWDDNYLTLWPGETRELTVTYPLPGDGRRLVVAAEAWNAAPVR
jgi:exo-1,4-beta-D-glucosaminidase